MKFLRLLTLSTLFAAPMAFAHSGHMSHSSIVDGILHPLTGFDHLIMMFSLGILISRVTSSLVTNNPATNKSSSIKIKFSLFMAALISLVIGLIVGSVTVAVTGIELIIAASTFVVALGIWNSFNRHESFTTLLLMISIGLVFFHGFAHGIEATGSLSGFGVGMLISALAIMFVGERVSHLIVSKWLGAGIAASNVALMIVS